MFSSQKSWISVPPLPHTSCMPLGRGFNIAELHIKNGMIISTSAWELICNHIYKKLAQHMRHSKNPVIHRFYC